MINIYLDVNLMTVKLFHNCILPLPRTPPRLLKPPSLPRLLKPPPPPLPRLLKPPRCPPPLLLLLNLFWFCGHILDVWPVSPHAKHWLGALLLPSLLKNLLNVCPLILKSNFSISLGTS